MGTTIEGDITGTIDRLEDTVSGIVHESGYDTDDDIFEIVAQGQYGTATIDPNTGEWTYTLNKDHPAVKGMKVGDDLIDTFTVRGTDTDGWDSGGTIDGDVTITITRVTCFARGTRLITSTGWVPVQKLKPGQEVLTLDGPKKIKWIGYRKFSAKELQDNPKLQPIRIRAGALGDGLPLRDLVVSRQHRMLVRSNIARKMFGDSDVLVPAAALLKLPGVAVLTSEKSVEYFHLLFDRHEIVMAEGAPSESFFTGAEALKTLPPESVEEIRTIMPHLLDPDTVAEPARPFLPDEKREELVIRHRRNSQPLFSTRIEDIRR